MMKHIYIHGVNIWHINYLFHSFYSIELDQSGILKLLLSYMIFIVLANGSLFQKLHEFTQISGSSACLIASIYFQLLCQKFYKYIVHYLSE